MSVHTVDDPFTGELLEVEVTDEGRLSHTLEDARTAARELGKASVEERIALCARALADLEEEFRRTGLPPGWTR